MADQQQAQTPETDEDALGSLEDLVTPTDTTKVEMPDVEGEGLTADILFGEGAEDTSSTAAEEAKPAEQPATETPAEEPAEKPAEEPEKPKTQSEQAQWDKDRQQRDQEAANERKRQLQVIEQLQDQNRTLTQLLAERKTGDKPAEEKPSATELTEDDTKALEMEITDESSAEEIARHIKALRKFSMAQAKELQDVKEQRKAETETASVKEAEAKAKEAWNAHLVAMDKKFGAHNRAEAIKNAGLFFASEEGGGYTRETIGQVSLATMKAQVAVEYQKLQLAEEAKKRPAATSKPAIKPDKGGGGRPAGSSSEGDLKDVVAQMRKEGKFRTK